jgi:type IV pilus assembly protein PilC
VPPRSNQQIGMTAVAAMRFAYQARDPKGQLVSGTLAAANMVEATKALRGEGKYIVDIKPARATDVPTGGVAKQKFGTPRGTREEVIQFTLQLSVMVDTGVPLSEALHNLAEQKTSPGFQALVTAISKDVQAGKDFSSSLERYPKTFPKFYTSLVRASEASGSMSTILKRLANYQMSQREILKKVKGALIYPAFMFVMSIGVTIFLLTFVLPKFTVIFKQKKAALPLPTQIFMNVSDSLTGHWMWWIIGAAVGAGFSIWFVNQNFGRRFLDHVKIRMPIMGGMFQKLYVSRSLQTIATMISAGVLLLDCLTIVRDVSGNSLYADLWEDVRQKVQSGQQLSEPLLKTNLVPRSVAHMIHSGEKSGELPAVMNRIADYMEEDLATAIKTATQFIEPVMIGFMGALIGSVAIAMLLPILTISKVMAE